MFPKSLALARLRHFLSDTRGYASVEAIIVLPALLWLFGVGWVYFDVFRQQSVNQKANYTIGDMFSRMTDPVNDAYIDSSYSLLRLLTKAQSTETDLRISVVEYTGTSETWAVSWSESRGAIPPLTDAVLPEFENRLPVVNDASQLILVETWDDYEPAFDVGLGAFQIKTYSFTQPRFAPQIVWATAIAEGGEDAGDGDVGALN